MTKPYHEIDHYHCWAQGKEPACGIPLAKHTRCCLCGVSQSWEKKLGITPNHLRITLNVKKLQAVLEEEKALSFQEGADAREKELLDALDAVTWDEVRAARTQEVKDCEWCKANGTPDSCSYCSRYRLKDPK